MFLSVSVFKQNSRKRQNGNTESTSSKHNPVSLLPFDPAASQVNIYELGLIKRSPMFISSVLDTNTSISHDPNIRNIHYFEQSLHAAQLETRTYPEKRDKVPHPPPFSVTPLREYFVELLQRKGQICSETILQSMKVLRNSEVDIPGLLCIEL